jgi:hypothetical protein
MSLFMSAHYTLATRTIDGMAPSVRMQPHRSHGAMTDTTRNAPPAMAVGRLGTFGPALQEERKP